MNTPLPYQLALMLFTYLSSSVLYAQSCPRTFQITRSGIAETYSLGDNNNVAYQDSRGAYYPNYRTLAALNNMVRDDVRSYPEDQPLLEWTQCHLNAAKGRSEENSFEDLDVITPQVSGCPRYLPKSLVKWSRAGGNPQLNLWTVKNVSNRILKVTFIEDGVKTDTATLNPGSTDERSLESRQIPKYVVRDFNELIEFNRTRPQARALQCQLAIQPR
jgi:hypothetical protein